MRPLLKWLTKDRRRRFVRDDGETYVVDNGVPDSIAVDTSAGMAIIMNSDPSPACDTSSSSFNSSDGGACSPPPDTSSF